MAIILIARGTLAGATAVAVRTAEMLGIPCLSREVLLEAAADLGIDLQSMEEDLLRPPAFFERWSRERESHLLAVRAALLEHASRGELVYHGYSAQHLLADVPSVLRARVIAPLEMRVSIGVATRGLSREAALRHIRKVDRSRKKWTQLLYGVDWNEPDLYDLVLNLEKVSEEDASSTLAHLARSGSFPTSPEMLEQIRDLALTARVQTALGLKRSSRLQIESREGRVVIRGWVAFGEQEEEIVRTASSVAGVAEVDCELTAGDRVL